jgi:branched-chain amino acid transport system permease protein
VLTFGLSYYWQGVIMAAGIAAIAALGLHLTFLSGQFSVMHAAIMGAAAYTAGVVATKDGWGLWATVALGALVGAGLGGTASLIVRRLEGLLLGIATLAIGQSLAVTATNVKYVGAAVGYSGIPLRTPLWGVAAVLGACLAVILLLKRTRAGVALLATGRDPIAAAALGIPTQAIKVAAFAAGGAMAGAAGAMEAQYLGLVMPSDLGFSAEVPLIVYVVIGGVSTPWGAVAGAFGVSIASELLRFTTLDRLWIFGLILTLVALTRPQGLLVRNNIGRPWRDFFANSLPLAGARDGLSQARRRLSGGGTGAL